jgi:hypothetical protein
MEIGTANGGTSPAHWITNAVMHPETYRCPWTGGPHNFGCPIQSRFVRLSGVGTSLGPWTFSKFVHHSAHCATPPILPACHPV